MKEKLIFFNKKNLNGRIYKLENFDNFDLSKEQYVEKFYSLDGPDIRLDRLCGRIINLEVVDETLIGEFVPLSGYTRPDDVVIRPKGMAVVRENGELANYLLTGFNMVQRDQDSFREFYE